MIALLSGADPSVIYLPITLWGRLTYYGSNLPWLHVKQSMFIVRRQAYNSFANSWWCTQNIQYGQFVHGAVIFVLVQLGKRWYNMKIGQIQQNSTCRLQTPITRLFRCCIFRSLLTSALMLNLGIACQSFGWLRYILYAIHTMDTFLHSTDYAVAA